MVTPQPGDYGVVATGGLAARLIRIGTCARYNHAFIVVDEGWVIEAGPRGVHHSHLDEYRNRRVAFNTGEPKTSIQRNVICATARAKLGSKYGWPDIEADILTGVGLTWAGRLLARSRRLDCSALVAACYHAAGVSVWPDKPIGLVNPGDLADRITRSAWC